MAMDPPAALVNRMWSRGCRRCAHRTRSEDNQIRRCDRGPCRRHSTSAGPRVVVVRAASSDGTTRTMPCCALLFLLVLVGSLSCGVHGEARTASADELTVTSNRRDPRRGAWNWIPEDEHPCNIRRVTLAQFRDEFPGGMLPALYPTPIVVTLNSNHYRNHSSSDIDNNNNDTAPRNARFRNLTTQQHILDNFPPGFQVTLSSSNSFSEHRRTVPFETYLAEMLLTGETLPTQRSNESWYLFGETYGQEWKPLLDQYELPPCTTCTKELVALSFGMGNRGSGVQWHVHGPGFSESIHGRKHWVLYAPNSSSRSRSSNGSDKIPAGFDKDESSRQWMEVRYPRAHPKPLECTLNPGDFIYFPDRYWHATINLDPYTVFVSSFTTEHHASDEL